jgi:hypothetical protein
MTIGFLDTDVEAMTDFKMCIDAHPSHNWCIYIAVPEPSWGDELMLADDAFEKGVAWMLDKKVDVLVLGKSIDEGSIKPILAEKENSTLKLFSSQEELLGYLKDAPETVTEPGEAKLRAIHLTKHSEDQDALMAEALGGFLLKD